MLRPSLLRSLRPSAFSACRPPHGSLRATSLSPRKAMTLHNSYSQKIETPKEPIVEYEYKGPLTDTMRRLKVFSLSSLGLAVTMTPFIFIVESNLPFIARCAIAFTAITTSGIGTALVSWGGGFYVTSMRRLRTADQAVIYEFTTFNMLLKPRITRVYDPGFLEESKKPFAKWELSQNMRLGSTANIQVGQEETIAETFDGTGNILGRWIVSWNENGVGMCSQTGKVVRIFNLHGKLVT